MEKKVDRNYTMLNNVYFDYILSVHTHTLMTFHVIITQVVYNK